MPVITSIKPQKNKRRVNIYLDGKFGFGLDLETFVKTKLKVEQEITEEEEAKIVKEAEFQKNYEKILKFAMLRPRSRKEIDLWLGRHRVHASLHPKLVKKLEGLDLLGDEKFAKWWVDQRNRFRPRSKRLLYQELKVKGIATDLIKTVIEESDIDEVEGAQALVEKNFRKWQKLDKFEARKKISAYLARKGYGWDVVKSVIGKVLD